MTPTSPELKKLQEECKQRELEGRMHRGNLLALEEMTFRDLVDQEGKCKKCGRTEKLTLDHIVPKAILIALGIDVERKYIDGNYQILCRLCNVFKGQRLDFSLPITKEILLNLIQEL